MWLIDLDAESAGAVPAAIEVDDAERARSRLLMDALDRRRYIAAHAALGRVLARRA